MENSNVSSNWTIISYDEPLTGAAIQRIVTLCILMSVTLVGNVIILTSLTCSRYRVRSGRTSSRVNIFMLHLAVGDLSVCGVTMSVELIVVVSNEWLLGSFTCKVFTYAQIVALASTIFILLAMSYDRYLAICEPLKFKSSVSRARRTIGLAWLLAFVLGIPQLFIFVQVQNGIRPDGQPIYTCRSQGYSAFWQRRVYFTLLTIFILVLPAAIIIFCYVNIVRVVWRQGQCIQNALVYRSATATSHNAPVLNKTESIISTKCKADNYAEVKSLNKNEAASTSAARWTSRHSVNCSDATNSRLSDTSASSKSEIISTANDQQVERASQVTTSRIGNGHRASVINLRKSGFNDKQMTRAKVRTIKLTLCIIVAFVVCWTPYFVVHNLRVHSHYTLHISERILAVVETLALVNSALNPIVYGYFNLRVKRALKHLCCRRHERRHQLAEVGVVNKRENKMSSATTIVLDELSSTYQMEDNNEQTFEWIGGRNNSKTEMIELKKRIGSTIKDTMFNA